MAARVIGISLLFVLFCGAVSPSRADEEPTAFKKILSAALQTEQAGHRAEAEKLFWAALAEAKKLGPDDPLWLAKTPADCKIKNIAAALPPLFCYNSWPCFDSLSCG